MRALLLTLAVITGVSGCGGSSSTTSAGSSPGKQERGEEVDYAQLKPVQMDATALVPLAGEDLTGYLKNGLRLQASGNYLKDVDRIEGEVDFAAPPADSDGDQSPAYSETNVHVAGVDEADVAKYDGAHWFVAYMPENYASDLPGIQIFATEPELPAASLVGSYSFQDNSWGAASSLYLHKDGDKASHLVAIRHIWGSVLPQMPAGIPLLADEFIWPGPVNSQIKLEFIDVSQPASPRQDKVITIEGALINSRRIGDTLYLISRFDPWLDDLTLEYAQSGARERNEQLLQEVSLTDLLPAYRIGDGEEVPLNSGCWVQESVDEHMGFYSLVNITAIDLAAQTVTDSQCLSTGVDDMTMSTDALYLTGSVWNSGSQSTTIHKFELTAGGAEYSATGAVKGTLRGRAPYRVHQYQDHLRVVTTEWDGELVHHLYVLEQAGSSLNAVAQLPNSYRPQPIGKPGEDIFAVRFQQDKAYIVTFRNIDPFYVVDLADPLDPKISGELEVPGFATYIHPLNDNYIFTLGHNVNADSGRTDGVKAQLIKIEAGVPSLAGAVNIGQQGSLSEALYDLRAMTLLSDGSDNLRLGFPVSVYAKNPGAEYASWQYSGLQMLELQALQSDAGAMEDKGILVVSTAEGATWDGGNGIRRAVLHGDAVYYAHDNQLWFTQWGSTASPGGPVGGDPIACTTEMRYGLEVFVLADEQADACSAKVTATDGSYQEVLTSTSPQGAGGCTFRGAAERAGRYDIQVELTGHISQTHSGIVVSQDACHVITRYISIPMFL